MWSAKTPLVSESELTDEQRAAHLSSHQLDDRERAVRAFALGDISADLAAFTHPEAQFIDIYATVRTFRPEFRPEHVLGIDPTDLVIDDGEGRGWGGTLISTFRLTKPATPRRPERHIVWTLTWNFTLDGQWILVGSHASAND